MEHFYTDHFAGLVHEIDRIDDKTVVVKTRGDVQPILDANKFDANHSNPWSASRDLKHVARIPVEIYMKWLYEEGIDALNPDHKDAVRRKLNSNEYLYLRSSGGTV